MAIICYRLKVQLSYFMNIKMLPPTCKASKKLTGSRMTLVKIILKFILCRQSYFINRSYLLASKITGTVVFLFRIGIFVIHKVLQKWAKKIKTTLKVC